MGIDLLQNHSESIPTGTYSRKYKFAATPAAGFELLLKDHRPRFLEETTYDCVFSLKLNWRM